MQQIKTLGDWQVLLDTVTAVNAITNPPAAFRTNLSDRLTTLYARLKGDFHCASVAELSKMARSTPLSAETRTDIERLCRWLSEQSPYLKTLCPTDEFLPDASSSPRDHQSEDRGLSRS